MTRIALLVCVVALWGCAGSSRLTETHGRAYRETFQAQRAATGAGAREAVKGLDSEEATIVATAYRQSLADKAARAEAEPDILYVAPEPRGGRAAKLAPSVPRQR